MLIKHRDCTFVVNVCTNFKNGNTVVTMVDFNDTDCSNTPVELYRTNGSEGPFVNYEICNYVGIKIIKEEKSLLNSQIMFIFETNNTMTFVVPEAYSEQIFTNYKILN